MKARSSFIKVIILFLFAFIFCVTSPAFSAQQEKKASMTAPLLALGVAFALFIGFIGGLFPAIRAARTPVALALREQ